MYVGNLRARLNTLRVKWCAKVLLNDWIDQVGGPDCAGALLSEKPRTVMSWYRFDRAPSLRTAGRIVRLTAGAVDYNGIYGPWAAVLAERDGVAA